MFEFESREFLLLALPVWYGWFRWGKLPGATAWLLAVPLWAWFVTWDIGDDATGNVWDLVRILQTWSGLLLPIPLWLGLRRFAKTADVTTWLRFAMVVLLLFALPGPKWNLGGKGVDLILVVDRSLSVTDARKPDGSNAKHEETTLEIIEALQAARKSGDRIAVVTYGVEAHTEQLLSGARKFDTFKQPINPHGSNLHDALQRALSLVDANRPARILILSDGESNGMSAFTSARRAAELKVPISVHRLPTTLAGDVLVQALSLPDRVAPHTPFFFNATIVADGDAEATIRLRRESVVDGKTTRRTIAERKQMLRSGRNDIQFADTLTVGGTYKYYIDAVVADDPRPQNNTWHDEVTVDAGPRMLLLVKDEKAKQGRLAKILSDAKSGIPTDVMVAKFQPLSKLQLDRYRGVILEDVPADHLGYLKMARLAKFVTDRAGGLLITGGENSFGSGGYFKSPLDKHLPVSMELRDEHHKLKAAIAIVLDRSGSMRALATGGQTKMELANLGTEECVRILSRLDMVTVIAVDTGPDVKQPLTTADDKNPIISRIRSIVSQGGGIYVDVALEAAKKELDKAAGYKTRHIILFSDARDTEISPRLLGGGTLDDRIDGVIRQVRKLKSSGITVSIIGLGREDDIHGGLLKEIAKAGGGNAMFTEDARDLPRLFTQDAMKVTRNTFLKKDKENPNGFRGSRVRGPFLIGELGGGKFPNVDGYNLTYKRKLAQAAVVSLDEYKAPWSAFWHRGLGRVAAIPFEISGKFSGAFGQWKNRRDFLLTHARWILGGDDPRDLFVEIQRDGQDAVVRVELDPRDPEPLKSIPRLMVIPPGREADEARKPALAWKEDNILETRFRLDRLGIFRTQLVTGKNTSIRGPSISLPYSPEFFPRHLDTEEFGARARAPLTGRETLLQVAAISGGAERLDVLEMLDRENLPRFPRMISLVPWLASAMVIVLLLEIGGRRMAWWERGRLPASAADEDVPIPQKRRFWHDWREAWSRRRKKAAAAKMQAKSAPEQKTTTTPAAAPQMESLIQQAKDQARRRRGE